VQRDTSSVVGAVLAGGRGRRIGGDKAIVELEGRPLLDYPLRALLAVLDVVAVVAKPETALPALDHRVEVWLEEDEPRHPLAGVVQALRSAQGRPVVVLAGDMPFVSPALVRALAEAESGGAPAVVARGGGGLEPLCARYDPPALDALEDFDPRTPAREAVAALGPAVLELEDERELVNVNSPEDLLRAAARLSAPPR
jgi:molybdopterin-guanine dinucleotide biosynthesis protein A